MALVPPGILSGALMGLAFQNSWELPTGVLLWFALVPYLLGTRDCNSIGRFIAGSSALVITWGALSAWWIVVPDPLLGSVLMAGIAGFLLVVFLLLWLTIRAVGWHRAMLVLPFLWTGWEWGNLHFPLSSGWLVLAHTHASLTWLNQIAGLFGVWGLSFWIIAMNAGFGLIVDRHRRIRGSAAGARPLAARLLAFGILMVAAPVLYSSRVIETPPSAEAHIAVSLVQPNTDPDERWNSSSQAAQLSQLLAMTDLTVREAHPDLVLWPEMAVPWFILDEADPGNREVLKAAARRWETPVIFGFPDVEDSTARFLSHGGVGAGGAVPYNAAGIVRPDGSTSCYRKTRLLPYVESMPFANTIPGLAKLRVDFGVRGEWARGLEVNPLSFRSRKGDTVVVGAGICYDQLYPEFTAELVRNGAGVLVLLTNDGWFQKSPMMHQSAAIARLRCIETRRWMVRCASNGMSEVIDPYGRVVSSAPAWEPFVLSERVGISDGRTLYVRYPDLFPQLSAATTGIVLLAGLIIAFKRGKRPGPQPFEDRETERKT
jgi:apolipoprotein N-acyltransferase